MIRSVLRRLVRAPAAAVGRVRRGPTTTTTTTTTMALSTTATADAPASSVPRERRTVVAAATAVTSAALGLAVAQYYSTPTKTTAAAQPKAPPPPAAVPVYLVALFGPPGIGKSTLGQALALDADLRYMLRAHGLQCGGFVSIGDLIRAKKLVAHPTQPLPADVSATLLVDALLESVATAAAKPTTPTAGGGDAGGVRGVVVFVDGFPRTVANWHAAQRIAAERQLAVDWTQFSVVDLTLPYAEVDIPTLLLARIGKRLKQQNRTDDVLAVAEDRLGAWLFGPEAAERARVYDLWAPPERRNHAAVSLTADGTVSASPWTRSSTSSPLMMRVDARADAATVLHDARAVIAQALLPRLRVASAATASSSVPPKSSLPPSPPSVAPASSGPGSTGGGHDDTTGANGSAGDGFDKRFHALIQTLQPYAYTYPPKEAFAAVAASPPTTYAVPDLVRRAWADGNGDGAQSHAVNVYVHIPFCQMKCSFCNLFTVTQTPGASDAERYRELLKTELDTLLHVTRDARDWSQTRIDTVHIGGGTPTLIPASEIDHLLSHVSARLNTPRDTIKEIAIEGSARSLLAHPTALSDWKRVGITRLSIGVQSFEADELKGMGRGSEASAVSKSASAEAPSGSQQLQVLERALSLGFANINVDLIYGLQHQTLAAFQHNVKTVIGLGVPTVTLYPLLVRQRTAYGKRLGRAAAAATAAAESTAAAAATAAGAEGKAAKYFQTAPELYRWYDWARDLLLSSGYEQVSLVLFGKRLLNAKGKGGNAQEQSEFDGIHTVGLGAGARTYAPNAHYASDAYQKPISSHTVLQHYTQSLTDAANRRLPVLSHVSMADRDERARRFVTLQLLRAQGIDAAQYARTFCGQTVDARFGTLFGHLRAAGLMSADVREYVLTSVGMRHSSAIAQLLHSAQTRTAMLHSEYDR